MLRAEIGLKRLYSHQGQEGYPPLIMQQTTLTNLKNWTGYYAGHAGDDGQMKKIWTGNHNFITAYINIIILIH